MIETASIATGFALSRLAFADVAKVSEVDSTALALGYRTDATKVDKAKYARYVMGQVCSNLRVLSGQTSGCVRPLPHVRR